MSQERKFSHKIATREPVPLLVGLYGPSGGGKTYSALRLASGIRNVSGGEIFVIDTESSRATHYAKDFKFNHIQFSQPFCPLDYLAAIEHCKKNGAKVIIIDSMSHEHEGPGGVLEQHDEQKHAMAKRFNCSPYAMEFGAWAEPKAKRQRMINSIMQVGISTIMCFRAKEKVKPNPDKSSREKLLDLGWMPITDTKVIVYEMIANYLLPPNSRGIPMVKSDMLGECAVIKHPKQFANIVTGTEPLSELIGEKMARWASGEDIATTQPATTVKLAATDKPRGDINATLAHIATLGDDGKLQYRNELRSFIWTKDEGAQLKAAFGAP